MKTITKQDKINTTAQRWRKQYPSSRDKVYKQLCALNNPTEQQITDAIGNDSWTANKCAECEKDVFVIIEVGQEPDYESDTIYLCLMCLEKAVNLVKDELVKYAMSELEILKRF